MVFFTFEKIGSTLRKCNGNVKTYSFVLDLEDILEKKTCSSLSFIEKWAFMYVSIMASCKKQLLKSRCKMHVVRMRNEDRRFTIIFVEESLYMYRRKYVLWLQLTKTLV